MRASSARTRMQEAQWMVSASVSSFDSSVATFMRRFPAPARLAPLPPPPERRPKRPPEPSMGCDE